MLPTGIFALTGCQAPPNRVYELGATLFYSGRTPPGRICAPLALETGRDASSRTSFVFEEEIKQIGCNYRTRQTIVSRAGEQLMIGQYLEKRIK